MIEHTKNHTPTEGGADTAEAKGERIAKVLARAGIASRRDVERMIAEGRVTQGGVKVTTPATLVTSTDGLAVDGKPVRAAEPTKVWLLHKPIGIVTTSRDPEGRPTVFSILPPRLPRVVAVGRLDINTEGLLVLTNDGALARWLELPQTGLPRRYRVRVFGTVKESALRPLREGVTIEGVQYGAADVTLDAAQTGANTWLTVTLREGKNREIRRLMEHVGLTVNRLMRIEYGPFALGTLPRGAVEPVADDTLRRMLPGFFDGSKGNYVEIERKTTRASRAGWAKAKPKDPPRRKRALKPTSSKPSPTSE